tara:strand:+ start:113 stop:607 length:495 start_codon:yes stop_codon:yes gene_type:complete
MKRLTSVFLALVSFMANPGPVGAAPNRPFSGSGLGCEFFSGYNYDDDLDFYARGLKFYTINPEWRAKYHSVRCSRFCKVFLFERPQRKMFYDSIDDALTVRNRLAKAQSAEIYCANDGDMPRVEVALRKEAERQRQKEKDDAKAASRFKQIQRDGSVNISKKIH